MKNTVQMTFQCMKQAGMIGISMTKILSSSRLVKRLKSSLRIWTEELANELQQDADVLELLTLMVADITPGA